MDFVIGIDGGGSRTRAFVANRRGEPLGTGEAGSCNPQAVGFDAAKRAILDALQRAFDAARLERQLARAACFGIGGVDREEERGEFLQWARAQIASRVEVMNDGLITLAAGTPDNWGIAIIAGTGSSAFGKTRAGKIARAGGWGYRLGDEGSAYDLARRALQAVTQAADGRGEHTILVERIREEWELRELTELVGRVYRSGMKPADFAQIAPLVIRAAEEGDGVARKLVRDAGAELARAILAVARALQFAEKEIPLALTGGLLLGADIVRDHLLAALDNPMWQFAPVVLVRDPVVGAVRIALDLAER